MESLHALVEVYRKSFEVDYEEVGQFLGRTAPHVLVMTRFEQVVMEECFVRSRPTLSLIRRAASFGTFGQGNFVMTPENHGAGRICLKFQNA